MIKEEKNKIKKERLLSHYYSSSILKIELLGIKIFLRHAIF